MPTKTSTAEKKPLLIKSIVVPINFSPTSANALFFANQLSKKLNAKITLLHAFSVLLAQMDKLDEKYLQTFEIRKKENIERLNQLCKEVRKITGVECKSVLLEGFAKDAILQYTEEKTPDLMVIGTENQSAFRRILLGTVTGKLIKECTCNMLIVPENATNNSFDKIAFAVDYHDSDLKEIQFLIQLTLLFGSELHLIRVVTKELNEELEKGYFKDFKERIRPLPSSNKIEFRLIKGNNIIKEIKKYEEINDIGILAIAKSQKSSMETFLSGSTTQKVFYQTTIPLLVFHAEDELNDFF